MFIISLSFIEPICPPLSQNEGRCGSSWGGRCNNNLVDYAVYCNEDNGWCGTTSEHKHAQSSDIYNWEPESCKTLGIFYLQFSESKRLTKSFDIIKLSNFDKTFFIQNHAKKRPIWRDAKRVVEILKMTLKDGKKDVRRLVRKSGTLLLESS